jgi:hypothetical protein
MSPGSDEDELGCKLRGQFGLIVIRDNIFKSGIRKRRERGGQGRLLALGYSLKL